MPPMMPPIMAPLVQPIMPPVMPPLVQQPMPQHVMPPMTQPPFAAEIPTVNHHERPQHESGTSQPNAQSGSGAAPKPFRPQAEEPFRSPFGIVKASWLPVLPQSDAQKIKKLPTPSMMNDYYATSPRIFPHMCSLCNIECTEMKLRLF
ncbi:zinc finger protein 638-like [Indicator indicator]|uniref:zinc finger protein 638-like n=1 Tax=Indicator indicator TaxID=1002788 RepID=UPI0023DEA938|nr:zinc finger protein 638-like [Indicator indicator]